MAAKVRISGLVRYFNSVRERLRRGIAPEDRTEFRESVREVVWRVEEICRQSGALPGALPPPSRKAYRFLKDLDLENLPEAGPGSSEPVVTLRISGVQATQNHLTHRLWSELDEFLENSTSLHLEIRAHASAIEDLCGARGADPSALPPRSRAVYGWLEFLADEENLKRHLLALDRARSASIRLDDGSWFLAELSLLNMSAIYRTKHHESALLLRCNEGLVAAPDTVWEALLRRVSGDPSPDARRVVHEFTETEEYADVLCEMEAHALPAHSAAGCHHDLDAAFERVNAAYFEGAMDRPKLVWNSIPTTRKLGHYQQSGDTVMISVTVDDPKVPAFAVDFLLYHELLHKKRGVRWSNGRRLAHDAAFRAEERRFSRFAEAEAILKGLSRR